MSRLRIPSFRDVDQKVLGLVSVVVLAAVVVGAFAVGTVGIFDDRYLVRAVFDRTGGLGSSSDVRIAGVSVGSVTGIDPDYERGHVVVTFEVDRGVDLGSEMRAEIAAATLLGGYYIRLDGDVDAPFLASLPPDDDRRVIPNNRTLEPTSLNQVLDDTTETVTAIDFDAANRVLEQVAGAADRNVDALPELIDDFTVISTAIAARDAELKRIVGGSEELLGVLAEREAELALLVESSGRLLDQLASRRDALSVVLDRGGAAVDEAASLLVTHGDAIDRLIVDVSTITTELGDTLPSLNEALTQSQLLFPLLSRTLDPAGGFSIRGEGIIVHPGQAANIVDTVEDLLGILEVSAVMITTRCLLAVVATSVALGGCALNSSDGEAMTVTAVFDNAVGIYETGDVLVLDQPVGEIRSIELFADRVEVEFTVRADVPLPDDVNAAIEAQSVLGERSIVLFPPWSEASAAAGAERLRDGDSIPATRTQVPVEPDEALQSVNELLSSLEPDVVGGLIGDSAQILDGRGERIGSAIDSAADLTDTLVAVDQPMLEAARSFSQVASTLTTRDVQLRTLIRDFGAAVDVLAAERADLQRFLGSLNDLTAETSGLLDRHAEQIPGMLATLAATLEVVEVNADSIPVLASNLPVVAESFEAAYKEELGGFFLKVNTSAVLETVIEQLLDAVGLFPGEI